MRGMILSGLLLLAAAAQGQTAIGQEAKIDSVLASVNGAPVTLLDVILESGREESKLAAMFTGERLYAETAKIRKLVVEDIIIRKLVYAKYKKRPFEIKDQHIEDMVDTMALSMGDGTRSGLDKKLKALGSNMTELREKAREKIAVDVMLLDNCERRVYITPREIYETYAKNPGEWTTPARVEIQLLLIRKGKKSLQPDPEKAVENLKTMLKNADGAMFRKIVKENSEGPNAAAGGSMGWIDVDKLRPEFAPVLKNAGKGTIAGPVRTPEGYYFIRVSDRADAKKRKFEEVSGEIRKRLKQKSVQERRKTYTEQLKQEAVIRYYF